MQGSLQRTDLSLQSIYQEYMPAVYRVAYTYMKNSYDSEDATQEAFVRLARCGKSFEDRERIKAWLVVTVANVCKDMLRRRHRKDLNLEDHQELPAPAPQTYELMDAIMRLPDKYKAAIYLYYYEGYSVGEIAGAMEQAEGTVKSWLHRARRQLKDMLGEDYHD